MAVALVPALPAGLIKQFLKDVHWGECDYLVIDSPPGTSDEHISIVQVGAAARAGTPPAVHAAGSGLPCWQVPAGNAGPACGSSLAGRLAVLPATWFSGQLPWHGIGPPANRGHPCPHVPAVWGGPLASHPRKLQPCAPALPSRFVPSPMQFLKAARVDGAVVVTTPQEVSIIDVRKEINFCKKASLRGLG